MVVWRRKKYENLRYVIGIQSLQFYACPVAGFSNYQKQGSFHDKNWVCKTEASKKSFLEKILAFGKQQQKQEEILEIDLIIPQSHFEQHHMRNWISIYKSWGDTSILSIDSDREIDH